MKIFLDRLEAISKILLILGTLIGGGWGVYQYFERLEEQRVAATLDYVKRLNSDPLLAAQIQIGAAWYDARDKLRLLRNTPVPSREVYAARQRQLVMSVMTGAGTNTATGQPRSLVADLDLLEGFFAELKICVDAGICDTETTKAYFSSFAKRLYCLHEPFISHKAETFSDGYGAALRSLALPGTEACSG